jgi:hypothetical protein
VTSDGPREGAVDRATLAELLAGGAEGAWALDASGSHSEICGETLLGSHHR